MYWYKTKTNLHKAAMAFALAALCFACAPSADKKASSQEKHIDIPAYFQKEIARLQQEKPFVRKTVTKDNLSETKELQIANWENELASFETIDLNKPAYAGLFEKDSTAGKVIYRCDDPDVDLSYVEIHFSPENTATSWVIKRKIKNSLYQTDEVLKYSVDSAYGIEKEQSVLILGDKSYGIEGIFKK